MSPRSPEENTPKVVGGEVSKDVVGEVRRDHRSIVVEAREHQVFPFFKKSPSPSDFVEFSSIILACLLLFFLNRSNNLYEVAG